MPGERFSKGSVTFVLYRFQNYWNFDLEYQRDKKKTVFRARDVTGNFEKRAPGLC